MDFVELMTFKKHINQNFFKMSKQEKIRRELQHKQLEYDVRRLIAADQVFGQEIKQSGVLINILNLLLESEDFDKQHFKKILREYGLVFKSWGVTEEVNEFYKQIDQCK